MMCEAAKVHMRLIETGAVKVRTVPARAKPKSPIKGKQAIGKQRTHGQRPVRVGTVTFPSLTGARKALRIGMSTLYRMLDSGDAEYAS